MEGAGGHQDRIEGTTTGFPLNMHTPLQSSPRAALRFPLTMRSTPIPVYMHATTNATWIAAWLYAFWQACHMGGIWGVTWGAQGEDCGLIVCILTGLQVK